MSTSTRLSDYSGIIAWRAAEMLVGGLWNPALAGNRHVLPNIAAHVIIIFSINIGAVIMSEASLSFLGYGLPIEVPSWGGMLSREGRKYMEAAPWLALWPGLCLTVVVYSLNMFGDAVRDLLDPRLRGYLLQGICGYDTYGAGEQQFLRHRVLRPVRRLARRDQAIL